MPKTRLPALDKICHISSPVLVEEFGSDAGFWEFFADGIENMQVKEGHILVKLKE